MPQAVVLATHQPGVAPRDHLANISYFHGWGLVLSVLTLVHVGALLYWLYLTYVKSATNQAGGSPKKAFKKFKIVYDFEEPKPAPNSALQPKFPSANSLAHKRNRSFADMESAQ